tara:strand:- start:273 stop:1019 length:747 start_codon:yes stop_codon:yes gene_type:complete
MHFKKDIRLFILNIKNGDYSGLFYLTLKYLYIMTPSALLRSKKTILNCPLCSYQNQNFLHLSNSIRLSINSACPNCHSRSRHRGLFFLYKEIISVKKEKKILHFAPEIFLQEKIKNFKQHVYHTTDLFMKNVNFREDLLNLSFKDDSYDIILNNHVLEHISNDKKAIQEIHRILKPKGIAIITVPGNWKKKTKHFYSLNNNGHYRDYGFDFIFKLKKVFKTVNVKNLFKYQGQKHAIKLDEIAFICFK